jgi:hypothetical protein
MTKPMIRIHNTETDEIIDREMTAQEIAQHEADAQTVIDARAKIASDAAAKAALLAKLGITADEAALLLG